MGHPLKMKEINDIPSQLKTFIMLILFVLVIGSIGYMIVSGVSFTEGLIQTIETLAFQNEKLHSFGGKMLQFMLSVVGLFIIWFVLWTTLDLVLEGKFKEYFSEVKKMTDISKLENHYIICGAGRVGIHIAKMLAIEKKPLVLIDQHEADIENAKKRGFLALKTDSLDDDILVKCNITKAKALVAVFAKTEENILVTLLAKELKPDIKVYARAEKEEFINTLRKIGAEHVIMPEAAGAMDIVKALNRCEKTD